MIVYFFNGGESNKSSNTQPYRLLNNVNFLKEICGSGRLYNYKLLSGCTLYLRFASVSLPSRCKSRNMRGSLSSVKPCSEKKPLQGINLQRLQKGCFF